MKIIKLVHRCFLLIHIKDKQYIVKNWNGTEKSVYKKCEGLGITPPFQIIFFIFLCIEYDQDFINLHDFLTFDYGINNKHGIISDIISKLKKLHERGIAWMDMKPENIIINTKTLQTFFIDFDHSFTNQKGQRIGYTFPYVAPEYFSEPPKENLFLLQKNDIFVLGMIIILLLGHARVLLFRGKHLTKNYRYFIKNIKKYQEIINHYFQERKYFLEINPYDRKLY